MEIDDNLRKEIELERQRERDRARVKAALASAGAPGRPLATELSPEIARQLDPLMRCNARTMMGQCQWPVIRAESFCPEHSSSERGKELRNRQLEIWRRDLAHRWREQKEFAWPNQRGAFMSPRQAEIEAERRQRLGEEAATTPHSQDEIEELMDAAPQHDALFMGQLAMSYLDAEETRHAGRLTAELIKEKAKAVVREIQEIRREQRQDARWRRRRKEIEDSNPQYWVEFRGDPSTPYGLIATADSLMRIYGRGGISQRRCEQLTRLLRIIAIGRSLGCTRPLKLPEVPEGEPVRGHLVQGDPDEYHQRGQALESSTQQARIGYRPTGNRERRTENGNAESDRQVAEITNESKHE